MKIKVYSTPTCPYCVTLKQWLSRHKVEFEEADVQADPKSAKEMMAKTGQMGVPVIEINGNYIIGFDPEKLQNILGINE